MDLLMSCFGMANDGDTKGHRCQRAWLDDWIGFTFDAGGMKRGLDPFNVCLKLKCRRNRLYAQLSSGWMKLSMSLNDIVFIKFTEGVSNSSESELNTRREGKSPISTSLHCVGQVVMCN